jgi:hypothetical protein
MCLYFQLLSVICHIGLLKITSIKALRNFFVVMVSKVDFGCGNTWCDILVSVTKQTGFFLFDVSIRHKESTTPLLSEMNQKT